MRFARLLCPLHSSMPSTNKTTAFEMGDSLCSCRNDSEIRILKLRLKRLIEYEGVGLYFRRYYSIERGDGPYKLVSKSRNNGLDGVSH